MSKRKRCFNPERLVRRAARQLADGDVTAQRTLKGLEHLLALDIRIKSRTGAESRRRAQLAERERELESRERALAEERVALNRQTLEQALEAQRLEELRRQLDDLYAVLYDAPPREPRGAGPATMGEIFAGDAPK